MDQAVVSVQASRVFEGFRADATNLVLLPVNEGMSSEGSGSLETLPADLARVVSLVRVRDLVAFKRLWRGVSFATQVAHFVFYAVDASVAFQGVGVSE
jgi:hypothetical protein